MSVDPASLRIVLYPDPILRAEAAPVPEVNDEVRAVVERMMTLMAEADGVGLAAPQVGLSWRLFVTAARDAEPPRVFINPVITPLSTSGEMEEEGCLSLPGVRADVRRNQAVAITALDLDGREFTLHGTDMTARVWQHEFDHLDGVLIIDRMNTMDRLANRRILRDLARSSSA